MPGLTSRSSEMWPLLDFWEDDVHVREGDAFVVYDAAVLAQFGPVLAVHILPSGAGVSVDGEASESLFQWCELYRRPGAGCSFAGPVRLCGETLGSLSGMLAGST